MLPLLPASSCVEKLEAWRRRGGDLAASTSTSWDMNANELQVDDAIVG